MSYKAIKNKINKTRQHRTVIFLTNKTTTQKKKKKVKKINEKENETKLLAPAPNLFYFERSINQSYNQ